MNKWKGKSKGTILGYRIFVWCIRNIGIRSSYFVLYFVAAYYFLFEKKSNEYISYYFKKRLNYNFWTTIISRYRSYFTFGTVLIDKTAISAGLREKFTYEFDGVENLKNLLAEKKGGVLISAHIGNFEIAEHFFADIDFDCQINLVTTDQEVTVIKEYLESVTVKRSSIKFIYVKDDMSHIFEINEALSKSLDSFRLHNLQLIWQTGKTIAADYKEKAKSYSNVWIGEFIIQMEMAYAAADIVISRSGAMAVTELCVAKKPVIFVPFPYAAEDHQTVNAQKLVDKKAALMIKDSEANDKLSAMAISLAENKSLQEDLSQNIAKLSVTNADEVIAKEVLAPALKGVEREGAPALKGAEIEEKKNKA